MKLLAITLALVACSDFAESIATAPCLWVEVERVQLRPPYSDEQSCWYIDPPDGLAVTPDDMTGCSAARWQSARVWPAGAKVKMWQLVTDDRKLEMKTESIACP